MRMFLAFFSNLQPKKWIGQKWTLKPLFQFCYECSMSRLVCEETEGKLSHDIQQKAAEYQMGGNLGSKEAKQITNPTSITS